MIHAFVLYNQHRGYGSWFSRCNYWYDTCQSHKILL